MTPDRVAGSQSERGGWSRRLLELDAPWSRLREPGLWFWLVMGLGLLARLWLVLFSQGSLDITVWTGIAQDVSERGVVDAYHGGRFTNNHPPFIDLIVSKLWRLSEATGIPFRTLHRAPYVLFDAGTVYLLIALLRSTRDEALRRARFALAAFYWLCPISIIFSSFHGNTDTAVAFFLTGAALFVAREQPIAAGAMLGASLWIKIPGVLAAPVLLLALPSLAGRVRFCGAAAIVGISTYLPALLIDARGVLEAIFLYSGLRIQTTSGAPIWGPQIFYPDLADLPAGIRPGFRALASSYYRWNTWICLVPIVLVAWLRRRDRGAVSIARGIAGSYAILFGLSNFWSFQYLAWPLPFWLLSGVRFGLPALLLSSAYVLGVYVWLCDSWLLLGPWDFIGKPSWPLSIRLLRDAATLFFFCSALYWIASAVRGEIAHWRSKSGLQ